CSNDLASAPQHEVADRSPAEFLDSLGQLRADANTGAELFVGRFKPRCYVDRIAIGGVVEKSTATEVSDNRRPRVYADTRHAKCDALLLPALAETLRKFIQSECAGDGAGSMVWL